MRKISESYISDKIELFHQEIGGEGSGGRWSGGCVMVLFFNFTKVFSYCVNSCQITYGSMWNDITN